MQSNDKPCCSVQAANYLNIKSLLDLTCQTVANMIKGAFAHPIQARMLFAHCAIKLSHPLVRRLRVTFG